MSATRIAARYAKSLLDLANEQGKLGRVLEDVKGLQSAVSNRDLYLLLKSPIINGGKKKQVFDALFSGKFDALTMSFLNIIVNKGRENALPEIANEFVAQYRRFKNISTVKVTSAKPLSEDALAKIKSKLLASNVTSNDVDIITAVDPKLLGGFVIEIGDKLYDSSVAHKLSKLRKEFTGNK